MMSQYFYGVCHDCKKMVEVTNTHMDVAERLGNEWSKNNGHGDHNFEVVSEYSNTYEDVFGRYKKVHSMMDD
jgi:hypothetical protein